MPASLANLGWGARCCWGDLYTAPLHIKKGFFMYQAAHLRPADQGAQVALITGVGAGIGRAIGATFAAAAQAIAAANLQALD